MYAMMAFLNKCAALEVDVVYDDLKQNLVCGTDWIKGTGEREKS